MGSKKHKKESKKKRHRSRSRSDSEERERKKHKKHKDRKKDRSPEVEEVPVDSHLYDKNGAEDRSRSRSISREVRARDEWRAEEPERSVPRPPSPPNMSSGNKESLSIEETNRIRAKLGLKPLEVNEKPAEDGKLKDDLGEFYHKPAQNLTEKKKTDKLREKIEMQKEKRKIEQKLKSRGLGDEDDGEDANAWVEKSREIERRKKEAAKRSAMLDELDAEFGVSALVDEEQKKDREQAYSHKHLKGLRVAHDFNALDDDSTVVLTLADKQVLADDDEDVLVNVNMVDNEKYKKNIVERKKARVGYQAYVDDEELQSEGVLSKYDEEIEPNKKENKGFRIGDDDALEAARFREMMARSRAMDMGKRLESLQLPALAPASDYYSEQEVQAKFKKIKKKGKSRKKPKVEPIDVEDYDPNMAPLETDDTEVKPEIGLEMDDDEVEPDAELQRALARARRLRQMEATTSALPKVEDLICSVKTESMNEEPSDCMVLDSTAEFCRTLGDIPTYGQAGNRDQRAEIMDFEEDDVVESSTSANAVGQWSSVGVESEAVEPSAVQLVSEPSLDGGVGAALQLALSKGYLEKAPEAKARATSGLASLLHAHHYSIDDKQHAGEDEKPHRRERGGYSGPVMDFREKNNFKPNIKLEYVDDDGRPLCPKEAFRYLSHKFHGKGPGKNKQEKRIKKAVQEGLMKKMSSTDTPLNTLALLQEKQKETSSPYIVLTGNKKDTNI